MLNDILFKNPNPMNKLVLLITIAVLSLACSSVKSTEQAINTGNYNKAISIAVEKLRVNKTKKSNQQYVFMLEDAYAKVTERDLQKIQFLIKEGNPEKLEAIYELYASLDNRQEMLKPLMPLPILKTGSIANFKFNDYSNELIASKDKLSEHLYDKSLPFVGSTDKSVVRNVYYDLEYIQNINPNYKDVPQLINQMHFVGTDFVLVSMKNETRSILPEKLQENLLNFDTTGLNDIWTVYHNAQDTAIAYDFGLELNLIAINVSPERINEKQVIEEKTIKDGFKYVLNDQGKVQKDSLGNKIKVDNYVKVRCELLRITQFKSSNIEAQVKFIDFNSKSLINAYPIESEFVFEHVYASHRGDKRALAKGNLRLLKSVVIPFPSNEQMVYDTGTDLKMRLKTILKENGFRE